MVDPSLESLPAFLSLDDSASLLGISRAAILRLVNAGRLNATHDAGGYPLRIQTEGLRRYRHEARAHALAAAAALADFSEALGIRF